MSFPRAFVFLLALSVFLHLSVAQDYEKPGVLKASEWWSGADWLHSDIWDVEEKVVTSDFSNQYTIRSAYGVFKAYGDHQLIDRIREIEAIRQLRDQSVAQAGGEGVAEVAGSKIDVAEDILTNPVEIAGDVPRGARSILQRVGSHLNRERRAGNYSGTTGPVKSWVGVDDKKREVAARLGVDPYSDNEFLQKELERVSTLEALPEFGVGFVIPGGSIFTVLAAGKSSRNQDAYLSSPSDLFVRNRQSLIREMGVPKKTVAAFLALESPTPAQQTVFVDSLSKLTGAVGRENAVEVASEVRTRAEFDFFKRNAQLLAWYHENRKPIVEVQSFDGLALGIDADGRRVLPFAVDYASWCEECGDYLTRYGDVGAGGVVVLSGRLTERASAELTERSIQVVIARP